MSCPYVPMRMRVRPSKLLSAGNGERRVKGDFPAPSPREEGEGWVRAEAWGASKELACAIGIRTPSAQTHPNFVVGTFLLSPPHPRPLSPSRRWSKALGLSGSFPVRARFSDARFIFRRIGPLISGTRFRVSSRTTTSGFVIVPIAAGATIFLRRCREERVFVLVGVDVDDRRGAVYQ